MTASVVPGLLLYLVMAWLTWALAALDAQLLR